MERSFERDIIPMARAEGTKPSLKIRRWLLMWSLGMALAPWNVLAGGKFRTDAEEARRLETGEGGRTMTDPTWLRNPREKAISAALEKVAQDVGASQIASGALLPTMLLYYGL